MSEPVGAKRCAGCQRALPLTYFSPRTDRPSGVRSRCRSCRSDEARARRDGNIEGARHQERRWYAANRERVLAAKKRRRAENREDWWRV